VHDGWSSSRCDAAVLGGFAAGRSRVEALALFGLFFVRQFPHFLAIRLDLPMTMEKAGLKCGLLFMTRATGPGGFALVMRLPSFRSVVSPIRGLAVRGISVLRWSCLQGISADRPILCHRTTSGRQLMIGSLICLLPADLSCGRIICALFRNFGIASTRADLLIVFERHVTHCNTPALKWGFPFRTQSSDCGSFLDRNYVFTAVYRHIHWCCGLVPGMAG